MLSHGLCHQGRIGLPQPGRFLFDCLLYLFSAKIQGYYTFSRFMKAPNR